GLPSVTADVTKTRSPQTTGDDQPRPGTSTFQTTFWSGPQVSGSVAASATPACSPPRKDGQSVSAAAMAVKAATAARGSNRRTGFTPRRDSNEPGGYTFIHSEVPAIRPANRSRHEPWGTDGKGRDGPGARRAHRHGGRCRLLQRGRARHGVVLLPRRPPPVRVRGPVRR